MSGQSVAVLLVDDDDLERTRSRLETIYGDRLRLDHAVDNASALRALAGASHDVALVADRIGDRDGVDLIREAVQRGCAVPLILFTRESGNAVERSALEAGAADYLVKGRFEADTLGRVIRSSIRLKRCEEALRESERRSRVLFDAVPVPMYVHDTETLGIIEANQAAVDLYGYTRDEFLGLRVTDIRPPEEGSRIREHTDQSDPVAARERHRKKDGTVFEAEITSTALERAGRPARVVLTQNVTERSRSDGAAGAPERWERGVLDSFLAHVAVVRTDGLILTVNRSWRESAAARDMRLIAGVSEGTNYLDACDAACGAELAAGLRAVLGGQNAMFEYEYADDTAEERRWFVIRVLPFLGEGPRRAVVAHIEITERKRVEEALRESEQRLQAVLDSSNAVIFLKDLSGRYLLVNSQWGVLFGTNKEAFLGKTDYDIFPVEVADNYRANDRLALDTGRAVEVEEWAPYVGGGRTYLCIKAPLYDVHGVPYGTCGIATDITRRLRAEEALRESEERFRGAFDSAAVGMAIVAPDGRFVEVNRSICEFTGFSEDELLATTFQAITHPDDLEKDIEQLRRLLAGEIRSYQMEKRYIHRGGHEVWGMLSVSVVGDARGAPLYGVGQVQDITPRKHAETALAQLLDRLKRLRQLDQAILSAHSPRAIAGAALDHLIQLLPCCCGSVDLFDVRGGRSTVLATRAVEPAGGDGQSVPGELVDLTGQVTRHDESAPAIAPPGSPLGNVPGCEGLGSVRTPLSYQGRLLGNLNLFFDVPAALTSEHHEVIREVADLLAIALRQARLFVQVKRGRRRLSALTQRLIAAQEAEGRRLARELHDEIGQSLTALKLGIQAGADSTDAATRKTLADEGRQIIDQLIDQVRNLSLDLRPSMLDDFGLISALRWYVDRLSRRSGIEARLSADPAEIRAAPAVETACFRIAQEALTNVTRHASARHAWVELRRERQELSMTVRDDGAGFDLLLVRQHAARGTGLGLLGMRERAALLGGRIEIDSAPGEGTRIHVIIPLGPLDPLETQ